jgi:hypothetical protein
MRAISLGALVSVCLVAVACSSTANNGGQGGQVGSGGTGDGGHPSGAGGNGTGGNGAGGDIGLLGGHSGDAGPDAANVTDCHPACGSGSVCVGTGVQGGAVFFADGGVCPAGRHAQGDICVQDLTFACMPIPSGCNGTATCACASSLCNGHGGCGAPSPGELTCILAVP